MEIMRLEGKTLSTRLASGKREENFTLMLPMVSGLTTKLSGMSSTIWVAPFWFISNSAHHSDHRCMKWTFDYKSKHKLPEPGPTIRAAKRLEWRGSFGYQGMHRYALLSSDFFVSQTLVCTFLLLDYLTIGRILPFTPFTRIWKNVLIQFWRYFTSALCKSFNNIRCAKNWQLQWTTRELRKTTWRSLFLSIWWFSYDAWSELVSCSWWKATLSMYKTCWTSHSAVLFILCKVRNFCN